jgi:peptidoglycan/xylan/chitin deacetylase (PgdA/CDA1 family)
MKNKKLLPALLLMAHSITPSPAQVTTEFRWPEGKTFALSLTFDDARASQVQGGTALLDEFGVKATFYVQPGPVKAQLEGWKKAVASGHEIGNHSINHPCSGNFLWAREKALEDYSIAQMRTELIEASATIKTLLGVEPKVFAYPCGQNFVGRGINTKSYVPIIAELFQSGRGWLDEAPNDPVFCDFAQLTGIESDGKDFEDILPVLREADDQGRWVVLAGHEMAGSGTQTTRLSMLKQLISYAQDPKNGVWLAPVGEIGAYVAKKRGK